MSHTEIWEGEGEGGGAILHLMSVLFCSLTCKAFSILELSPLD